MLVFKKHEIGFHFRCVCVCVYIRSVVQSCQTLSTLMDCSPPGSSVHEIVQARVLECISISYSKAQSQLSYLKSKVCRPSEGRWAETNSYNLLHFAFSIANASNLPNLWSNRCPEKLGELCGISQVIFFLMVVSIIGILPAFFQKMKALVIQSCSTLCHPWSVACQASLSMEFSRQEYWSGLPFPSPVHLPDPGIKPRSPALQAYSLPSESPGNFWKAKGWYIHTYIHTYK